MPAPVGVGSISVAQHAINGRPQHDSLSAETAKGKSVDSPAHKARAAIKAAELGETAPANLHGKVTSAIARGIDISSLLVLQSVEPSDVEIAEDVSAPVSDAEDGSAPVSDSQSTAEEQTSLDAESSATAESGTVGSTDVESITEAPIAPPQIDDNLVDLLIENLDEDAT